MQPHTPLKYHLKGFKIANKDYQRNIQFKLKLNNSKNHHTSEKLLQSNKKATSHHFPLLWESDTYNQVEVQDSFQRQQRLYTIQKQQGISNEQSHSYNKRMAQCLKVIFKKIEADTDKLMIDISRQYNSTNKQEKASRMGNMNFLKRMKMSSMKMRKKEKSDAQDEQYKKQINLTQAHIILQRIRKTEQFAKSRKIEREKHGMEDINKKPVHNNRLISKMKLSRIQLLEGKKR